VVKMLKISAALEVGLLWIVITLLLTTNVTGQTSLVSPSELIQDLAKADPHDKSRLRVVTCGDTDELRQDRTIARELVRLDKAAIPELERALDSIEKGGEKSKFFRKAGWMLLAYARIQGPAATPRLRRMITRDKLSSLRIVLDQATALSLGLTSYVSSPREPGEVLICRRQEPRDALDQLIMSFEQNDRSRLEASLGPNAHSALDQLLDGRLWEAIRQEKWHVPRAGKGAVGYIFDIPGRWSEPEETLKETGASKAGPLTSDGFALYTEFKNSAGRDCGGFNMNFRKVDRLIGPIYQVNNSNLEPLLSLIAACVAQ
jgi:hypothetical protein